MAEASRKLASWRAPASGEAPRGPSARCLAGLKLATGTAFTGSPATSAQPPLAPAELAPHFPQLEIIECLGRGGMGVVYKVFGFSPCGNPVRKLASHRGYCHTQSPCLLSLSADPGRP